MSGFLPILLGLAMFGTLAILVAGIVGFAFNGEFYNKHANHLMRARVIAQGIAIAIFALIVWLAHGSGN